VIVLGLSLQAELIIASMISLPSADSALTSAKEAAPVTLSFLAPCLHLTNEHVCRNWDFVAIKR
jgi:hypothetical protein